MISITGTTFKLKDEFKDFGGVWNPDKRSWDFRNASTVDRWRGIPGLIISEPPAPTPTPHPEPKFTPPVPFPEYHAPHPAPGVLVVQGSGTPAIHGNDLTYLNAFTPKNPPMFAGFASFPDLIDFVEAIPASIVNDSSNRRNTGWDRSNAGWAGSRDMPEAISVARNGWRKGTDLALEAGEIITSDHATQRRRHHGVAGGRVNVGRMLSGNPLHMVSRPRLDGRKVITLFVQVWMSAAIKPENAIIRAASVAAIADVLEGNGYSCEIVAVGTSTMSSGRGPGAQVATIVKSAGEPLNVENVAFALGHPSMLRRFMFAVCAVEPQLRSFWSGMGGQCNAFEPDDLPPGGYYIPKLTMDDQNLVEGDTFKERVRSLFPLIVPDGLKIGLT